MPWLNYDGRNYLEIVVNGYSSKAQKNDLRVFFPLYPLLIKALSLNLLINPVIVGLGLSLGSFLLSLYFFDRLLEQDKFNKKQRLKILLLLILFPTSFYFACFYTESLFLLLTVLAFYFLDKKNIFGASVAAGLASATRPVGLVFFPIILWEGYKHYKTTKKIPFSVLLAPLGFASYFIYIHLVTGNAFSIVSQQKSWGRSVGVAGIWFAFRDGFLKLIFRSAVSKNNFLAYSIEVTEFVTAFFLILIIIFSFKKIKFSYWLYLVLNALIIFSTGVLGSIPRLAVILFPVYIYQGKILPKAVYYLVLLLFFLLLIYYSSLFLRGYWVA